MKLNELRVGNLINYDERYCTVEIINRELEEVYILGGDFYYSTSIKNIDGIPLTEDWLLKLGLKKNEGWDNMVYFNKNDIHIYKCNNSDKEWFEYECELLISSVHQLQNLYFALTNEELIIKL